VLFVAMSVIWGIPYLLIKVADGGVSVPVLVFSRVTIGAAMLLPMVLRRRQLGLLRGHWRWLLLFAVVEVILPWALLSDAERRLSSSMSGLLIASVPILGLVLAKLTGGPERLTVVRWVGLLAGVAGVGLLAGPGAIGGGAWPVAEVLLTALGYATGPLIADRKLNGLPGQAVTGVCLGLAAVVYAPAAAITWPSALPRASVLAALATLGGLCTALAFLLFFKLIAEVGPARATVITYVNPAVAVVLGVIVLREPFTPEIGAAFALILAGSVMATRSGLPGRGRPGAAPEDAVTGQAATGDGVTGDGVTGNAVPVEAGEAVGGAVPGEAKRGEAVLGEAALGEAVLGEAVLGEAVLGEAVPGGRVPRGGVPGGAAPGATALGRAATERDVPAGAASASTDTAVPTRTRAALCRAED
jgi:drug/metabolite transporter (DMT)-like permease